MKWGGGGGGGGGWGGDESAWRCQAQARLKLFGGGLNTVLY